MAKGTNKRTGAQIMDIGTVPNNLVGWANFNAFETAYNNASDGTLVSGFTTNGQEGAWFCYKGHDKKDFGIFIHPDNGLYAIVRKNGSWEAHKLFGGGVLKTLISQCLAPSERWCAA